MHLSACFLSVMLATVFIPFIEQTAPGSSELLKKNVTGSNLLWVANGVLLTYLLIAPRWRWLRYLVVGVLALATGNVIVHEPWRMNLLYNVLDITEVLTVAHLLRGRTAQLPRFTDPSYLLRFFALAVLAVPIALAVVYALIMASWTHLPLLKGFLSWVGSESLGVLVITPLCVAIFQSKIFDLRPWRRPWRRNWLLIALTTLCAIGAFAFNSIPLLFLIYPMLVVVALRAGLSCSAFTLLLVAIAGSWYTVRGQGVFVSAFPISPLSPTVLLQLYCAIAMFMLYSVSLLMEQQKATEQRLQKIVYLHNLVVDNSRDAIILADLHGNRTFASAASAKLTGYAPREVMKLHSLDLIHPEDRKKAAMVMGQLQAGAEGAIIEVRVQKCDQTYFWAEASLWTIRDPTTNLPTGLLNIVRDISERKRAEQEREFQNSLIRAIQDVSLSGIMVVNDQGSVVSMNHRLSDIWKFPFSLVEQIPASETPQDESDPIRHNKLLLLVADLVKDRQTFVNHVEQLYADSELTDQSEIELNDGRTLEQYSTNLRSEAGQYLGRVWFFSDITERKQAEEKLQQAYRTVEALSLTDALTGLANRRRFDQVLSTEWRRALRDRQPLSLLMIDVDLFKLYNDTYGHLKGDSCLKQIAEAALDVAKRPGDLVARFGGEEFAVILPHTENAGAVQLANQIRTALCIRKLPHSGHPGGAVTISVGCATLVPSEHKHAAHLIELADTALYKAKREGRDRVCSANPIPPAYLAE
jgi:diguanylate cyclase (GGDEF)-like protein/PAS domain S-box-containing protein